MMRGGRLPAKAPAMPSRFSCLALLLASTVACSVASESAESVAVNHAISYGTACAGSQCEADAHAVRSAPRKPSPSDGLKNGDESDVDCGGVSAPKCGLAQVCNAHADCTSDACSYEGRCVPYASCTAHFGGDTCGSGETGEANSNHESCCTRVNVDDRPSDQGGSFAIDKYAFTAGRMRAILERLGGNLKKWAFDNAKPDWGRGLMATLPDSMDAANVALGPEGKRGCNVTAQGGRTFWQPPIAGMEGEYSDFSKDALDEKALNCVPWTVAAIACAIEGGHMVTLNEVFWVYENRGRAGGGTSFPWQWNDASPYDSKKPDSRVVHHRSYETPNPPATLRLVGEGYALDHAFWIAPPGRRPGGANMHGVEDIAGNVMPWVSDKYNGFTWTQSWEDHEKQPKVSLWNESAPQSPLGYYAIGVRCAYAR